MSPFPVDPSSDPRLLSVAASHPYPLAFATVSGAHLYGFPSADSDFDLRGVHLCPLREVVGLGTPRETVDRTEVVDGAEVDLVTHDAAKFFGLLLRRNGYVLEQVLSPLVVHAGPGFDELRDLAARCVTRHHAHHYLGFARTQRRLVERCLVDQNDPPPVKAVLYLVRVLLTGRHLMDGGRVEANLVNLLEDHPLPWVPALIAAKRSGGERDAVPPDSNFCRTEFDRLTADLEAARDRSSLPDRPDAAVVDGLNDLLVRLRLS